MLSLKYNLSAQMNTVEIDNKDLYTISSMIFSCAFPHIVNQVLTGYLSSVILLCTIVV